MPGIFGIWNCRAKLFSRVVGGGGGEEEGETGLRGGIAPSKWGRTHFKGGGRIPPLIPLKETLEPVIMVAKHETNILGRPTHRIYIRRLDTIEYVGGQTPVRSEKEVPVRNIVIENLMNVAMYRT